MHVTQASRTAGFMAFFRALESGRSKSERLFEDPWATSFLGRALRFLVGLAGWTPGRFGVEWAIDRLWPGARASGIARTRLIDDILREVVETEGFGRIVFLGAGYDTRAQRLDCLRSVEVIEVDHPNTLRIKRERIPRNGPAERAPTYLGVDFDRDALDRVWADAGLARPCRSIFVWEGVSNYLKDEAVDSLLAFVSSTGGGNLLLFTYVDREAILNPERYRGSALLRLLLRSSGEPWTFGIEPSRLESFLCERGFDLVSDTASPEYRARYLGEREASAKGYEFYHAALARVR